MRFSYMTLNVIQKNLITISCLILRTSVKLSYKYIVTFIKDIHAYLQFLSV